MIWILFILLGCADIDIGSNRVEKAYTYVSENFGSGTESTINVDWFLSGGIKNSNQLSTARSEASIMHESINKYISNQADLSSNINWNYILDEKSTNTAENFIRASTYINSTIIQYEQIYVVTSEFHYLRASKMLGLIDSSKNFKWILADKEFADSRYWESIHIKNVEADVEKAKMLLD